MSYTSAALSSPVELQERNALLDDGAGVEVGREAGVVGERMSHLGGNLLAMRSWDRNTPCS